MLTVSDYQIPTKSCYIESRINPKSPTSEVVHETKFSLRIPCSTHANFVRFVSTDRILFRHLLIASIARNSHKLNVIGHQLKKSEKLYYCFITSNDRPFDSSITCTGIESQCYFVHRQLQQSISLANLDVIFVDDCY